MSQFEWIAEWSGQYPNHCRGSWTLTRVKGTTAKVIDLAKAGCPFVDSPAGTYGHYEYWTFGDDWLEEWYTYANGLGCHKWCRKHRKWLAKIAPKQEWPAIFRAFQAEDWRHECCGGCI